MSQSFDKFTQKKKYIHWSERCQQSFDKLISVLISVPVLSAPNINCFKLAVNANDNGVGSVLLQEEENGVDHPVCYFSKRFNTSQMNYSTIEK